MSEPEIRNIEPDGYDILIIFFIIGLSLMTVLEAVNNSSSSTEPDINMTGAFTNSELDSFCSSQGFDGGYYSEIFDNYTCYNHVDFNRTEIGEKVNKP